MKKYLILFAGTFSSYTVSLSQSVGIGTTVPNVSAILDIASPAKGILIPRMHTATIPTISNPAKGLIVYDSVRNQLMVNMGTATAPGWQTIVSKSGWSLTGNNGINPTNEFIGNTDNQPLRFRVNNIRAGELHPTTGNIFLGLRAGQANTTGFSNIALGTDALKFNATRSRLVAIGDSALFNNSSGYQNTAIGSKALYINSSGYLNTALGANALYSNMDGSQNTAVGYQALYLNSTGIFNTAIGLAALNNNTGGFYNTAIGYDALYTNTTGQQNTCIGSLAMYNNSGAAAHYNTAVGMQALSGTTNSQYNTAIGYRAAISFNLGYNNTILGANCGVNADDMFNCIAIGQGVICTASSQARIGNSATNSIGGYANWTNISDGRYKKNVQENVKGTDFIMKLRPVTYQLDVQGINNKLNEGQDNEMNDPMKQSISEKETMVLTGFIAQEVESAARESGYNFSGLDAPKNVNDFYGLRYGDFVVPLTKAVQEQQVTIQDQQVIINKQQQNINDLQKRLQTLEEQIKLLLQTFNNKN